MKTLENSKKAYSSLSLSLSLSLSFLLCGNFLNASCPTNSAQFCNVCVNGIIIANTGIFNNLTVTGASIFEGPVTITNTTESFACDEGALVIDGGVGIMGNLNVCGAITATGGISFTGPLIILDHTQSLNCSGGALAVPNGGVGIGGNLNVCGTGTFGSPVIITSTATG